MERDYGPRLGTIRDAQLQAALDRFDLGTLLQAEPVRQGIFGQNIFLTTTSGKWVLRGDPHYRWQLPKERFFARHIHQHTPVPAPWPYLIDDEDDIFGWRYALMPRLPGVQVIDSDVSAALTEPDVRAAYAALGTGLAALHSLEWPRHGQYSLETDTVVPAELAYGEWVANEMRASLALCRSHSARTTDADVTWVEDLLAAASVALSLPFAPAIVHHDFSAYNTVQMRDNTGWRLSGVFDLMEAFVGDGERDLPRQVALLLDPNQHGAAHAFVAAYFAARPPREGAVDRARLFMLDDRLVIWEYAQRTRAPWFDLTLTLREWAGPYVDSAARLVESALSPLAGRDPAGGAGSR